MNQHKNIPNSHIQVLTKSIVQITYLGFQETSVPVTKALGYLQFVLLESTIIWLSAVPSMQEFDFNWFSWNSIQLIEHVDFSKGVMSYMW